MNAYDPCAGFDKDSRSPYYHARPDEGYCALCGEPIEHGEEIVRAEGGTAHYECYRYNAPEEIVLKFLGITKETA